MSFIINEQGTSRVAIVNQDSICIHNVQDALDLMATIQYEHQCHKIILQQSQLIADFFELRTKLAGDILQKYVNYGTKLAIVGEFSLFSSKSLNDFIYECNQGKDFFFKLTLEEALEALHAV